MSVREPDILALQESIARSKCDRAKALTLAEKLRAGASLYDEGMQWMALMIESQNPQLTAEEVDAEIERRKRIIRQIDDNGLYQPCGMAEVDDEV